MRKDVQINQNMYVSIFYLKVNPALHVVYEATWIQAARWLPNVWLDCVGRLYINAKLIFMYDQETLEHTTRKKKVLRRAISDNIDMVHIAVKSVWSRQWFLCQFLRSTTRRFVYCCKLSRKNIPTKKTAMLFSSLSNLLTTELFRNV